jgi:hypothetical protein
MGAIILLPDFTFLIMLAATPVAQHKNTDITETSYSRDHSGYYSLCRKNVLSALIIKSTIKLIY